jgi:tetratricopeptide (TPR) repeat protein
MVQSEGKACIAPKSHALLVVLLCGLAVLQIEGSTARLFSQCGSSDPRYSSLIQRGQKAKETGHWSEAVESFQQARQLQPNCSLLNTQLGGLYYNNREYAKALTYFKEALATNAQDFYAAKFGGSSAYWLNRYGEAIRLLDRAKAIRSNDGGVYYWLGECYYAQGDRQRAVDELERAAHYDPQDVEILYLLGEVHWELSQQAWDAMEKVDPTSYRVEQMIAERYVLSALYPDAIKEYQIIIKQKPEMPGFHEALGKLYLRLGDSSNAENELQEELKLDPHSYSSYCELGDVLFQQQNLPAALENAKKAVAERPDFGEAYELLGKIYMQLGRKQEAVSALEQATHLLPSDPRPYYRLAQLYAESGQSRLATRARNKYEELMTKRKSENSPGRQ